MQPKGMRCELLPVEGAFNVRDLGGYPGREGKALKMRRFIRSGSLGALTEKGREDIYALGVRCVVDLRSRMETQREPDVLHPGVSYHHISMLDYIQSNISTGDFTAFPTSMADMYRGLLDNSQSQFGEIFHTFADPAHPSILFHCTAGKDRTGVTAMLLLLLAGVAEEIVVEDYCWSEELVAPLEKAEAEVKLPHYLFESKAETMEAAIRHLNEIYGGAQAYLDKAGVTRQEQQNILEKLLG